jgi:hypothetical protein
MKHSTVQNPVVKALAVAIIFAVAVIGFILWVSKH